MPHPVKYGIVVVLLLCYALASFSEPLTHLSSLALPGAKPSRVAVPKPTKPLGGASYLVPRRHLPLTKSIGLPSHEASSYNNDFRNEAFWFASLPEKEVIYTEAHFFRLLSRPPPFFTTLHRVKSF